MNRSLTSFKSTSIPFKQNTPHKKIRQWGIMAHITADLCLLNLWSQVAKSSTIPHWTPNNGNTKFHNSLAIGQCIIKWSIVSSPLLHMQYKSTTTTWCLLKLSIVKILPKAAVQRKKLTLVGTFDIHMVFQGKGFGW